MSDPNDQRRFRQQYNASEWARLEANIDFREAIAPDDLNKAGLVADRVLKGEALSPRQLRNRSTGTTPFGSSTRSRAG
jgi:hypothetical protein